MSMANHHSIFYKLWSITAPRFSENTPIKTAAVWFDNKGKVIIMEINSKFWESLTPTQKRFVVCHETLHMLLNHGARSIGDAVDMMILNRVQDIVINERLVSMYGFNRIDIDPENKYCWKDTIFPDRGEMSSDESFEYYFNEYMKDNKNSIEDLRKNIAAIQERGSSQGVAGLPDLVDDHDAMGEIEDINDIADILNDEEKEHVNDFIKSQTPKKSKHKIAGLTGGNTTITVNVQTKIKRRWESVIKRWVNHSIKNEDKEVEQWVLTDRRMNMLNTDLMLPSDHEYEDRFEKQDKIDVWFFQDTSGSCMHHAERFFAAVKSIPKNKFNVRLFCFDTKVYETTMQSGKLYGFGGTAFDIIEDHIQKLVKTEKCKYPKSVWVITDGGGNSVNPQFPERWHWFLDGNYTRYIPSKSITHNLKDYE